MQKHGAALNRVLDASLLYVATWNKDPDQIYGWACGDKTEDGIVIHYIYVKTVFRRRGIATLLLQAFGHQRGDKITATHRSWVGEEHGFLHCAPWIEYDPYLFYECAYD